MSPIPQLADDRVLRPAETALALKLISRMDFLRLKSIARWHARGLPPDVTWDDLLQEAELALGRVLDSLEQELIEASDEDILEAARDLGMNPMMKGSAAFVGLNYPATARVSDFFDPEMLKQIRAQMERIERSRSR